MKNSNLQSGGRLVLLLMVAVAMSWLALGLVDAAQINITNQCPEVISAYQSNQSGIATCYALAAGTGSQLIDVGTTWLGGLIWGYPGSSASPIDGNNAKPQADLAEITINGFSNTDSYDLSNVVWHIYKLPFFSPSVKISLIFFPAVFMYKLEMIPYF
ncbi:unnamed protein product [Sphagnum troendelagicum]|uniref:Uncharacterized protein n=1 Tax=Sphagnum troendelagicum TaxID=128251 RepID=A0ABP0UDK9_9BRYO